MEMKAIKVSTAVNVLIYLPAEKLTDVCWMDDSSTEFVCTSFKVLLICTNAETEICLNCVNQEESCGKRHCILLHA